jgi:tetratricopeptide (TPR) repeat protein
LRKKILIGSAAALVAAAVLLLHLIVVPAGQARVVRRGDAVRVLAGRVGFAPRYLGRWCGQPWEEGALHAALTPSVTGGAGESYELAVDLRYRPPERLVGEWPEGDWCRALAAVVAEAAGAWVRASEPEALLERPAESEAAGGAELRRALEARGLAVERIVLSLGLAGVARPQRVEEVAAAAVPGGKAIVLALDGADWQLLRPYMAEGRMPELAELVEEGIWGDLATLHPPLSPIIWTTMMTGASPLEHGILDFTRYHPVSGAKEPITSDERQRPAVWNMATYAGKKVGVFGLWATYPAEPVNGVLVSDRLFTFLYAEAAPPAGAVYPPSRERWAREARAEAERGIGYEEVHHYLPWLDEAELTRLTRQSDPYSHPVSALHRILVETLVYRTLAREFLEREAPDLAVVYIQGTDSIGHVFAPYAPPRQPSVSPQDYERYHRVPALYFAHVDGLIGEFRRLAEKQGAALVLVSDHGFLWHEGRPEELSSFAAATAAKWHREDGIYLVWRPGGGAAGERPRGEVDQTAATLMALVGLPPGEGIENTPLGGLENPVREEVAYHRWFQPPASPAPAAAAASEEELAKLRALGYLGASEPARAPEAVRRRGSTRSAGSYNNAGLILRRQGDKAEAIEAFERALEIDPDLGSAAWNLSDLLFAEERDLDLSDELLVRSYVSGSPEGKEKLIGRAIGYGRAGQRPRAIALLESALTRRPDEPELWLFRGRFRVDDDCPGALADFRRAVELEPDNPTAHSSAGLAQVCVGDHAGARRSFERSLALDPAQPRLRGMLAQLASP